MSQESIEVTGMRGCNFLPDSASERSYNHLFFISEPTGTYNSARIAEKLDALQNVGIRHIRVWQNGYGFAINRDDHVANLTDLATLCQDRDMLITLIMFDGVGDEFTTDGAGELDKWYSPWYDILGTGATSGWDPTSRTNPGLANSDGTGLLDEWTGTSINALSGYDVYPGLGVGDWLACPGGVFTTCFSDHTILPLIPFTTTFPTGYGAVDQSGVSGMYRFFADYIDETIGIFTGALSGTLFAIDLANEIDVLADYCPYVDTFFDNIPTGVILEFPLANSPGLPSFPPNQYLGGETRLAHFLGFYHDYVKQNYPGWPVTMGHFDGLTRGAIIASLQYVAHEIQDFFSFHNYGNGWSVAPTVSSISGSFYAITEALGPLVGSTITSGSRPFAYNEFWRTDVNTEEGLPWMLWITAENGWGAIAWDFVENDGWNIIVDPATTDHWFVSGYEPSYDVYPSLGFIRHYEDPDNPGTYITRVKNEWLARVVRNWAASGVIDMPDFWVVNGPQTVVPGRTYTYNIVNLSGEPFYMPEEGDQDNAEVHWIVAQDPLDLISAVIPQSGSHKYYTGPTKVAQPGFGASIPSGALYFAVHHTGLRSGGGKFDFTVPANDGMSGCDYYIGAWVSNSGVYDPDLYDYQFFFQGHPILVRTAPHYQVNWYQSELTVTGNNVGGNISTTGLTTDTFRALGNMVIPGESQDAKTYYTKLFIDTSSSYSLTGTKIYITDESVSGHIAIAVEKIVGDTGSFTGMPEGYSSDDFSSPFTYDDGLDVSGVSGQFGTGMQTGIWIQYTLSGDDFLRPNEVFRDLSFKLTLQGYSGDA